VRKIEANNLYLSYKNRKILDDVSLSLESGRITALIGPNGAGKSSAFRILAGLVKPAKGIVKLDNVKLKKFEHLRKHCGYMLESPDFYPYLTGKKNLDLLIQLSGARVKSDNLLQMVGLQNEINKKVQHYSRGMKQRLGFAQALIDNPDFLILDEPFNGLDPEVKLQMLDHLVKLKNDGKGILVSTHMLEDIESVADDFILLNKGRVYLKSKIEEHLHEKQNVTLFFSKPIHEDQLNKEGISYNGNKIKLTATITETEELMEELGRINRMPYRITRSSVLYDKYMEITHDSTR
jgi:ABC-2 type transport system ATP-binding protein